MTVTSRRPMGGLPGTQRRAGDQATAKKPVGRPQGEPSTIVNVQLPLTGNMSIHETVVKTPGLSSPCTMK